MATDRKDHWEKVYCEKSEKELSWHQDSPAVSLELAELAGLSAHWSVIDIGGGTSRFAAHMADLGIQDVTVVDLSKAALDAIRKQLGARAETITWVDADITKWEPGRRYDLWHDRAVFHFLIDRDDQTAYIDRLSRSLKLGAHAIIATFAPDGPETCSGLPVARYSPASLGAALGDGFERVADRRQVHHTPWGSRQPFQFSIFRRSA